MTQQPQPTPTTPAGRSAVGNAIMWTTAAVGGLMILGIGASAASAAIGSAVQGTAGGTQAVSTRGVTDLDLNIGTAEFTLAYGPVTEATLEVTGPRGDQWRLSRDEDSLVVTSPRGLGGSCWFGFCPPDRSTSTVGTLTLPQEFATRELDLDATVGVGQFTSDGRFGSVSVEIGAGEARLTGMARDLDVTVGVGEFTGEFTGVQTAAFDVSMGELDARLRGAAPRTVDVTVGVGSATLELPDEVYAVQTHSSLGDMQNDLRVAPDATARISAEVSLGELVLRPGS